MPHHLKQKRCISHQFWENKLNFRRHIPISIIAQLIKSQNRPVSIQNCGKLPNNSLFRFRTPFQKLFDCSNSLPSKLNPFGTIRTNLLPIIPQPNPAVYAAVVDGIMNFRLMVVRPAETILYIHMYSSRTVRNFFIQCSTQRPRPSRSALGEGQTDHSASAGSGLDAAAVRVFS